MDQKTMDFYNTDIISRSRLELKDKGYVFIEQLKLSSSNRKLLIEEARKAKNNLALISTYPLRIYVKKEFYRENVKNIAQKQSLLEIEIKSQNPNFIEELMALLKRSRETEFTIISSMNTKKVSVTEQIVFLGSNIMSTDLNARIINCLKSYEVEYVFEIIEWKDDLIKIRNFGEVSLLNMEEEFKKKGLDFNNVPKKLVESAKFYRKSIE